MTSKNFVASFNYLDALEEFLQECKNQVGPTIAGNQLAFEIPKTRLSLENLASCVSALKDTINAKQSKLGKVSCQYVESRNRIETLEAGLTQADC